VGVARASTSCAILLNTADWILTSDDLMTERLYYHDSYLRQFEARVVKSEQTANGFDVVLDATAFYPTSGGQPHDLGLMAGARIQDVVERDEEIVHRLTGPVAEVRLQCEIDWARRFDHMQQHTGQHVLSQAFVRAAKRNTVGFHMGADYVTIDLDAEGISPQQISTAEHLANEIIYENRPGRPNCSRNRSARTRLAQREPENWAIACGFRGRFRCFSLWRHTREEDRRDWKHRCPQGGARQSASASRVRLRTAFGRVGTTRFGNPQLGCSAAFGRFHRSSGSG
jgi:Ser-tRNA(Ala) deacylase AlaX